MHLIHKFLGYLGMVLVKWCQLPIFPNRSICLRDIKKCFLIASIVCFIFTVLFVLLLICLIAGYFMLTYDDSPDYDLKWMHNELIIDYNKLSISNWTQWNNLSVYSLWIEANSIDNSITDNMEYYGEITIYGSELQSEILSKSIYKYVDEQTPRKIESKLYFKTTNHEEVYSFASRGEFPKWWKYEKGYSYYQLIKGSKESPPLVGCHLFVSPDKKHVVIYQLKYTRM